MAHQSVTLLGVDLVPRILQTVKDVLKHELTAPIQRLRAEANRAPGFALLLLAVLLFSLVRAIRGDRWSAAALIPLSLAWLLFNGPVEGPTLLVLSWSHGITASDLISLLGLSVAAWRLAPVLVHQFQ